MSQPTKHHKAASLKDQADRFAETLWTLRNSPRDLSRRQNRVFLSQAPLPGYGKVIFDGGARFDKNGTVKAIGLRQDHDGVTEEFVVRTTRSRTTIIRKVQPHASKKMTVMEASFSNANRLLRYREETLNTSLAG